MVEIWDTFQDAEMGKGMGRGHRPPHPTTTSGERCKLPQRGPGRSPGRRWIWCILGSTERRERTSDGQKCQNDQLQFGTIQRPEWPWIFFGTGPQNSGLSPKIWDGWSPYLSHNQKCWSAEVIVCHWYLLFNNHLCVDVLKFHLTFITTISPTSMNCILYIWSYFASCY